MPPLRDANGRFIKGGAASSLASGFIPNPKFEEEFARSSSVRDGLLAVTKSVAADYAENVPVDEGRVQEAIFADVANVPDRGFVGRAGSTDWKAALVELGTSKSPARPALRNAAEANGLKLEEERR